LLGKIDTYPPNGAQTVPNDLTVVTVKVADVCNYHCAIKGHSAHEIAVVAPDVF
jgi:hypothetical protein